MYLSPFFQDISWRMCTLTLKNLYAAQAREHPLAVFDAIFKFAARTVENPPLMLFHPCAPLPPRVLKGASYPLELVFPHATPAEIEAFLHAVGAWLSDSRRHFAVEDCTQARVYDVYDATEHMLYAHQDAGDSIIHELCIEFITPLPHKSTDKERKRFISAPQLVDMCLRRIERVYGAMSAEEHAAYMQCAERCRCLPWMWKYEEFHHRAKSTDGTKYVHGFMGSLWLQGDIAPLLPVLAVCRFLHMGRRLHAGQGAFQTHAQRPFGDVALQKVGLWQHAARCALPHMSDSGVEAECAALIESTLPVAMEADVPCVVLSADQVRLLRECLAQVLLRPLRHAHADLVQHVTQHVTQHVDEGSVTDIIPVAQQEAALLHMCDSLLPLADINTRALVALVGSDTRTPDTLSALAHAWHALYQDDLSDMNAVPCRPPLQRHVHIDQPGATVGMDDGDIYARYDGEKLLSAPLAHVSGIFLYGVGSVSGPLIRHCLSHDIALMLCSSQGHMQGVVRRESARWYEHMRAHNQFMEQLSPEHRLFVAKSLIACKIENYIYWLTHGKKGQCADFLETTRNALYNVSTATSIPVLLGVEGALARVYFRYINDRVVIPEFHSLQRRARHRNDRWNALLDMVSSWIFGRIHAHVHAEGLNPYAGFLHKQHLRYATLVADIQEIFRHRTDRWVLSMVNQGIIRPEHFAFEKRKWNMVKEGRKIALAHFEQELHTCRRGDAGTLQKLMEQQVRYLQQWMCQGKTPHLLRRNQWWALPPSLLW